MTNTDPSDRLEIEVTDEMASAALSYAIAVGAEISFEDCREMVLAALSAGRKHEARRSSGASSRMSDIESRASNPQSMTIQTVIEAKRAGWC